MGKVVVSQFISVDGVVEDPGGSESCERGGWAFKFDRGHEGDKFKLDELMASDALLLGRDTYEGFAEAWPSRTGDFADKFNGMPKYVASTTLGDPAWSNTTVLGADLAAEVARAQAGAGRRHPRQRQRPARARRWATRPRRRVRLMVFPTVLGAGKRLFGDAPAAATLRLVESRPAGDTLILIYAPAGNA